MSFDCLTSAHPLPQSPRLSSARIIALEKVEGLGWGSLTLMTLWMVQH